MNKVVVGLVVLAIAAAGAYFGLGIGAGMSEADINARLKERQKVHIDTSGKKWDMDDFHKIGSVHVKGKIIRHGMFLQTDDSSGLPADQMDKTKATIIKAVCADADAVELIASGAQFLYEISARDDAKVGTYTVPDDACAS